MHISFPSQDLALYELVFFQLELPTCESKSISPANNSMSFYLGHDSNILINILTNNLF